MKNNYKEWYAATINNCETLPRETLLRLKKSFDWYVERYGAQLAAVENIIQRKHPSDAVVPPLFDSAGYTENDNFVDKEIIWDTIRFMKEHVIECDPNAGCGRCDDARRHVKALYTLIEPEQEHNKDTEYIDEYEDTQRDAAQFFRDQR